MTDKLEKILKSSAHDIKKEDFEELRKKMKRSEKGGIKDDEGLIRPIFLEPEFLEEMAYILTKGADKYGDFNWKGLSVDRIKNCLWRHMLKYLSGIYTDEKYPNGSHLAAIAVNAMFLYILDEKVNNANDS
jgi:hypothetical protein